MISRVQTNSTRDCPNVTWLSYVPISFAPCGTSRKRPVTAHRQSLFTEEPKQPLVIGQETLVFKQHVDPPIAEPPLFL